MTTKEYSSFSFPKSLSQNPSIRNGRSIFHHWSEQLQVLPASPCIPQGDEAVPDPNVQTKTKTLTLAVRAPKRKRSTSAKRRSLDLPASKPLTPILPAPLPTLDPLGEAQTTSIKSNAPKKKDEIKQKATNTSTGTLLPMDDEWYHFFNILKKHKETHGTCIVRQHHDAAPGLSKFIARMRALYKKGRLQDDQIKQLESIGFRWNQQLVYEEFWNENFDRLVEFYQENGHINVWDNHELVPFIQNSRRTYDKGKMNDKRRDSWEKLLFAVNTGVPYVSLGK